MTEDARGPLADREWRLIREEARDGPMQMALDEIAAETAASGGPRTVRVYRWEPSTLSLGYHQDPDTVDWDHCAEAGVSVTRRQTGGGGIYHDYDGDVSYSIVAPKSDLPGDLMDCYRILCEPILDAFRRMGVGADFVAEESPEIWSPACYLRALHPAHDVVAEGRKISGNAQYRRRDAVIQHGSLTYSVHAEDHLDVFSGHDVSPEAFRERVVGVDELSETTRSDAVAAVESALAEWADAAAGSWSDEELDRARERVAEKYADDEWVRRRPKGR
ncbi:lipoate--protein ligase family protein [Halopelagius longus]|uniref:Lipoate--protein ligase family protein n=1 Tax=Halopelagius longus TaxID=1236180 RepID=A0A1H1DKC7_9EURY|nr:biotin/lipoate A/B protein ligase family protein [Halopelagius longus]RDI71372.1 lipoate--protein ligase family protein [Halopelagius longus]SDQ77011.1 lipoate-protein ligase A [Halopelagius longus]